MATEKYLFRYEKKKNLKRRGKKLEKNNWIVVWQNDIIFTTTLN